MDAPAPAMTRKRIHPLWRCLIALVSLAVLGNWLLNYQIASAINYSYFKSRSVPLTVVDVGLLLLAIYLCGVAMFGRWLPTGRVR